MKAALEEGYEVRAVVRHTEKIQKADRLEIIRGNVNPGEEVKRLAAGAEAFICVYTMGWEDSDPYENILIE